MNKLKIQQLNIHHKGPAKVLGNLESKIMELLWTKGEATVREVCENLAKKKLISFNTVMTVMNRLTSKQLLQKQHRDSVYWYQPRMSKEKFCQKISENIFRELLHDPQFFGLAGFLSAIDSLDAETLKKIKDVLKQKH